MDFTLIDGNIKQKLLPFQLTPGSHLNQGGDGYKRGRPQFFTFRDKNPEKCGQNLTAQLNFCPTTKKEYLQQDISNKLLYAYNNDISRLSPEQSITFESLCKNIPGIQIREFLPDTALDQTINFFFSLFKEIKNISFDKTTTDKDGKTTKVNPTEMLGDADWMSRLWNATSYLIRYLTSYKKLPNGKGEANMKTFSEAATTGYTAFDNKTSWSNKNQIEYNNVLKLPHMLYYRLQGCTTTNIYELPCLQASKRLYSSDGMPGWDEIAGFSFMDTIPGMKTLKGAPLVGNLINKMFGNLNISFMPWWDAGKGNATHEPPVEISFDLFNDTNESALMNFIFVNTLIPNNKWIQYGIFQHSSCLYDVKLEGYNRLFACTGKFEVTYDGVLRDPPNNWFSLDFNRNPLSKYINQRLDKKSFIEKLRIDKLIKIPDIYKVKMTFESVLPSNFNMYLYTLVANDNHIDTYQNNNAYDESLLGTLTHAFTDGITGAINAFSKESADVRLFTLGGDNKK